MRRRLTLSVLSFLTLCLAWPAQASPWKRVGQPKAWANTIAGAVLDGKIYTVEASGALYVTEPATGAWRQIGKSDFANTHLLMAAAGKLFTLEKDGSLYTVSAADGSWKRLGSAGAWANTIAGVGLGGKIYSIEAGGALYVTDSATGVWKQIGKPDFANTRFMLAAAGKLFTLEKDGSLYAVSPADGSWKRLGSAGAWANTIAACGTEGEILTIESSGSLYRTNPASGVWRQFGQPDFAATAFMLPCAGDLFTLEKDGSLYQVNLGGAGAVAAPAASGPPAATTKSAAAVAGNLTFAFMGQWKGDTTTYEKDPNFQKQLKAAPEMAKGALSLLQSMTMTVTLDGITMTVMGEKVGPIKYSIITSEGNTLVIESVEPGKPPTRQQVVFLDAKRIMMSEKGQEAKALFFAKQ